MHPFALLTSKECAMRHHQHNPEFRFVKEPVEFDKFTERTFLQYCLGATLYMPGTKKIVDKLLNRGLSDITSMVMCFEDAIQENDLLAAEINVLNHLEKIADAISEGFVTHDEIPLIFLRVRNIEQFKSFGSRLTPKQAEALSGFVFPKFCSLNAADYLELLASLSADLRVTLYGMPILEGEAIAYKESRTEELFRIKNIIEPFKEYILNVRVGGTDFSALFGVRRGINYSIYDILTVRDCLSDVLNFFGREIDGYTISAPVWEYFLAYKRDNLDTLLQHDIHRSLMRGSPILNDAIDGLLREVIIDKANGFVGKTIIHPSHARFVNAMQAVTHEEYDDAVQILGAAGGVVKSAKANKMNEINPHKNWAKGIVSRAKAYGVVENEASFLALILG